MIYKKTVLYQKQIIYFFELGLDSIQNCGQKLKKKQKIEFI